MGQGGAVDGFGGFRAARSHCGAVGKLRIKYRITGNDRVAVVLDVPHKTGRGMAPSRLRAASVSKKTRIGFQLMRQLQSGSRGNGLNM